jgi:hypothetical protein
LGAVIIVARLFLLFVFEHLGGEIVGVLLAQAADGEMPFVVAGKIEVIGRIGRPVACRVPCWEEKFWGIGSPALVVNYVSQRKHRSAHSQWIATGRIIPRTVVQY